MVSTRAPKARPSWIAIDPMPPAPPWTRIHSPGWSLPIMNALDHTVQTTSGRLAACSSDTPAGTGIT